jgi:hypothetical protein
MSVAVVADGQEQKDCWRKRPGDEPPGVRVIGGEGLLQLPKCCLRNRKSFRHSNEQHDCPCPDRDGCCDEDGRGTLMRGQSVAPNAQVQGRALGVAEARSGGGVPCNAQLGRGKVRGWWRRSWLHST